MAPRRVSLPGLALLAVFAMYALQHVTMFVGPSAQHGSTSASMIKGQRLSVVVHARGGARGGVAETQSPLSGILLALGACIGLYIVFLINYGFLICTDGDYSVVSLGKCAVLDTLLGADDLWFQVRCKLKLIEACKVLG